MEDTTQAVTVYEPAQAPAPIALRWTREDLDALKLTIAKDLTDAQFKVFIAAARRLDLDPFAKQVQCWIDSGKLVIYTTIDGLRLVAKRTRRYTGQRGPFWCGSDGVWHDAWVSDDPPAGCRFGVVSPDFDEPVWGFARFKSYNKGGGNWAKMPDVMLAKVAESLAIRRAFPNETSGLYSDAELHVNDDPNPGETTQPAPQRTTTVRPATVAPAASAKPEGKTPPTWESLRLRALRAGVTSQEDWDAVCEEYAGTTDHTKMTTDGKTAIVRYIKQQEAKLADAAAKVVDAAGAVDLADIKTPHMVP